jgi:hypothetical protein
MARQAQVSTMLIAISSIFFSTLPCIYSVHIPNLCYASQKGKTHTMFGPPGHLQNLSIGSKLHKSSGVIPRAIVDIFEGLASKSKGTNSAVVFCSFVQVYNENLFDMLRDGNRMKPLELREGRDGVYVQGLSE